MADDVPELRRLLRHVLEWSDRFDVVGEAKNGAEAVALAAQHHPDLLLLDLAMPIMGGLEALPQIRAASPATRVVILSGFEAERNAQRALGEGALAYLEKGIPPALLLKQLVDVMEGAEASPTPPPASWGPSDPGPILDVSPEEMMSLVAHEVRNPLAVIQGFGSELQTRWETMPDPQRRDAVKRMTERARYLSNLVNNLMFLRRLESGVLAHSSTPQEVAGFLEALRDELDELARGHPLDLSVAPDLPPVQFDLIHLRQVLTNLVVNAAKFSPAKTPIRVRAFDEAEHIVIDVSDEGPGIAPDQREEVFAKYRRLSQTGSGIGLGLFISRSLITAMGGEMRIEDSERGTCFRMMLPKAR